MTREEYAKKAKDIMINKNPYGMYHRHNFDMYEEYGEMAPINSDIINNMPNSKIVLSEEIYEELLAIKDVTNMTNQEFPFFLYGKEIEENVILFTDFMSSSSSEERESTAANFNEKMVNNLLNTINERNDGSLIVCHGHSHPAKGSFSENFSLGDFTSYIQMNQDNPIFKKRQVELISCLVTSTGNINFVFYDNYYDNFYRVTDVFVKDKNNNLRVVNCYGMNQENNLYNTNFRR